MLNLRKSLTLVALAGLLAVSLASAKEMTDRVTFSGPVNIAGVTLEPGQYTVKVADANGSETDVVISNGKQEVRAKANWITLERKAPLSSALLDSQRTLKELRFGGKTRALSFNSASGAAVD
jgi:hypothetical protein